MSVLRVLCLGLCLGLSSWAGVPRDDAVAGSPGSAGERGADPASVPNVLIVLFDDVAERDVGTISTPAFDRLAAGGLRFRRAYAAPMCSPARRQLLFGYYQTAASGSPCAQRSEFTPPSPSEPSTRSTWAWLL